MSAPITLCEALPETNRRDKDGNLIIKRPEGRLRLFRKENVFICCGRGFLTIQSLENHAEKECLLLECNADLRPINYHEICRPGHLTNLLVKHEIKIARLKYVEKLKASLPNAVIVLEKLQLPFPKQEPVEVMTPNSLEEDSADMPHLSPIKTSEDMETTLSESSLIEPPVIEPIISLFPLPDMDVEEQIVRHECKVCPYVSKFAVNLRNHYKREHPRKRKVDRNVEINKEKPKLSKPNDQKKKNNKKTSIFSNSGKNTRHHKIICKLCGYNAKLNLKRHMQIAHVQNSNNKCQYCGCSFASKFGLRAHVSSAHKIKRAAKRNNSERDEDRGDTYDRKKHGKFSCPRCPLRFQSKFCWKYHLKNSHIQGKAFPCRFCTCTFRTKETLGSHVMYHHKRKSAPLHSKWIQFQFKKSKSSVKSKGGGGINCRICGKHLKSKCFLSIHTQVCHVPNGQPCMFCPCKFSTEQNLKTHITRQHNLVKEKANYRTNGFVKLKKTRLSDKVEHSEEATKAILTCPEPECKCPILDQETLELHMKLEHSTKENSKKTFSCYFCLEIFENNRDREIHAKREHEKWQTLAQQQGQRKNKPLTCDLCPTKIYCLVQLRFHLKTAHNPSFTHKCPNCPCRFEREKGLKYHTAKNHKYDASEKLVGKDKTKFICHLCGRQMHTLKNLKCHLQRAHVKDGKYECKLCPCRYGSQNNLMQHMTKSHKNEIEEKEEYLCSMCDYKTRNSEGLQSHLKKAHVRDGRFFCTMCSCRFSDSTRLTCHMTKRHNVVNYEIIRCDVCSIEVYSEQGLSVHKKLAHVPDGMACSYCPCTFDSKSYLDDHLKKDHSDIRNENVPGIRACRLIPPVYTFPPLYIENANAKEAKPSTVPCGKCDALFQIPYQLKDHMKRCHAEENHVSCPYCPCVFANEVGVKIHISNRHNKNGKRKISSPKSDVQEISPAKKVENLPTPAKKSKLKDIAETIIKSHQSENKSQLEHFHRKDESGDISFNDDILELKSVINVHQRSPLKGENSGTSPTNITCRCKKCGTVFRSTEKLLDHLKNFHGVNSLFKCSMCEATFVNPNTLTKHLLIHASSENIRSPKKASKKEITENEGIQKSIKKNLEKFTCKKCSSPFDSLIKLGLHMQMRHGTNGIECKFCSSSFDSTTDLTIHHTIYHFDEKELFSGTTITLKGASAIGSHYEHTYVRSDVLNTQIPSKSENASDLDDGISITALELDQISNSVLNNLPDELECETLQKDINLEEEFPTVFEYIMDSDRESLAEVKSLRMRKPSLYPPISEESKTFVTLQGVKSIADKRKGPNTFEIIDLTIEKSKNCCEFIDLTNEISSDSSDIEIISSPCNESRKTLQIRREPTTAIPLGKVQVPSRENFERLPETEPTFANEIFNEGSKDDDIICQKENTETMGDDLPSNQVDPTNSVQNVGNKGDDICQKKNTETIRDDLPSHQVDPNNSLQKDDNENDLATFEPMTRFTSNRLSSFELEELLTQAEVLCATTNNPKSEDSLLKDANYCSAYSMQNNFDLLHKEAVFGEAGVTDTGSTIDVESNFGAEECLDIHERTFSEASTDYEEESSDVDYSDICFRCGDVVLNRKYHEISCSGMDVDFVDYSDSDVCFRCGDVVLNRRRHKISCSGMDLTVQQK